MRLCAQIKDTYLIESKNVFYARGENGKNSEKPAVKSLKLDFLSISQITRVIKTFSLTTL